MKYISSDTNIWFDFHQINRLEMPFALDYTFCMSSDAIIDELISPPDMGARLQQLGLVSVEFDDNEYMLVMEYGTRYPRLSFYDRIALAIAKNRGYILLTGDGAMRKAAANETVVVHGTLWVFDQLRDTGKITQEEYRAAMKDLLTDATGTRRLPLDELRKRLTTE